jgi:8-oxo-dGTP diphosphatase
VKTVRIVAAVIERDGQYLITQRRASAVLPLLWEFPGGRVEAGETDAEALRREVLHRLGVDIVCGALMNCVTHPYAAYSVDLFLYACTLKSAGKTDVAGISAVNVADFRWVKSSEFESYEFTPADEASMNKLLGV